MHTAQRTEALASLQTQLANTSGDIQVMKQIRRYKPRAGTRHLNQLVAIRASLQAKIARF
jgi:hypothetical protein